MRTYPGAFAAANALPNKEPRWVVEVAFDSANTVLRYLTSHPDCALPPGGSGVSAVLMSPAALSQTLNPDEARSEIGRLSFAVADADAEVTTLLNGQLALGRSTYYQRVRLYRGFKGAAWGDYALEQTQLMADVSYRLREASYAIKCDDIQRQMRERLFEPATTQLAASIALTDTTITVYDTSAFNMVAHGPNWSDAPSATVGYVRIKDMVVRYTGKNATQFTGCTLGVFGTAPAEIVVDPATPQERREKVEEFFYLELPVVDCMYRLLTGKDRLGNAVLPANWHLGIPTDYVRLADFTGIGADLWDLTSDEKSLPMRLDGSEPVTGKEFIEQQLARLAGCHLPVYADGAIGLKRMASVLTGASGVAVLTDADIVEVESDLHHDFAALRNVFQIRWHWELVRDDYARTTILRDTESETVHQGLHPDPLELEFRTLHGSRYSEVMLAGRFDALRDRYTGIPIKLGLKIRPSLDALEVGDVVRVVTAKLRDFNVAGGVLDRAFEIQRKQYDFTTGNLSLSLFASSRAAAARPLYSGSQYALPDAWYSSQGTALGSVLTIVAGHVTANGTLTGNASMTAAGAIYYYLGDLTIDAGVVVDWTQNVQLRVMGVLTINGAFNGKGAGLAGAAAIATPANPHNDLAKLVDVNFGTAGFLGVTSAARGQAVGSYLNTGGTVESVFNSGIGDPPPDVRGANASFPPLNITYDGTTLNGIPSDMRGTSGSTGGPITKDESTFSSPNVFYTYPGGAGGAGGAGLMTVSRGVAFGVSGYIDSGGGDGATGNSVSAYSRSWRAGSGAGGAPGAVGFLVDGALSPTPSVTIATCRAKYGKTPVNGTPHFAWWAFSGANHSGVPADPYTYLVGSGDDSANGLPLPDMSGTRGAFRVQFVPTAGGALGEPAVQVLPAPGSLSLSSGTDELQTLGDGTVIARIKAEWSQVLDSRAVGYELRWKRTSSPADAAYSYGPPVLGLSSTLAWVAPVVSGATYEVGVRAAGRLREVSSWTTVTGFVATGKLANPSTVGALAFDGVILSWPKVADLDVIGYVVRKRASGTDWDSADPAHGVAYLTDTQIDTGRIVGGSTVFLVRALDSSGNLSTASSTITVDLRPGTVSKFLISPQPDGTRQFDFGMVSPPPPSDLAGYRIRWYSGSTSDWDAMTALHDGLLLSSPFEINQLAAGTYTFAIKAEDRAGNLSAAATFVSGVAIPDPRMNAALEDRTEHPTWTGTKTSCHVDAATGWLLADGSATWATLPSTWSAWTQWNYSPVSPIQYLREIDLGAVSAYIPYVTVTGDGTLPVEESHSNDGIGWSAYAAIGPLVTSRYIRVRVTAAGTYPKIKTLRIVLSGKLETELLNDVVTSGLTGSYRIGTGDIRLPITTAPSVIKQVNVVLQNVGGGWSWELIDRNTSPGPRVKIYNASNTLADATIDGEINYL